MDPNQVMRKPEEQGVWAENAEAVLAFISVSTQLRHVVPDFGSVVVVGLDYSAAAVGLEKAGIDVTPRLWRDMLVVERAAVGAMNRRAG